MRVEHIELIHDYFNLDDRINRTKLRTLQLQREFDSLNYYGNIVFDTNDGVKYQGFRLDSRVINYVDSIALYNRHIMKLERRKHHFKTFTHTLDRDAYLSFERRYKYIRGSFEQVSYSKADERYLNEILEIEQAISSEFNDPLQDELNRDYIEIEQLELTNETLEESLDRITDLLGV